MWCGSDTPTKAHYIETSELNTFSATWNNYYCYVLYELANIGCAEVIFYGCNHQDIVCTLMFVIVTGGDKGDVVSSHSKSDEQTGSDIFDSEDERESLKIQ